MKFPLYYPVTCHTDYVGPKSTFVAINGQQQDGHAFILSALKKGAHRIVAEQDKVLSPEILTAIAAHGATVTYTPNSRKSLAELSAQATGHIHRKFSITAITGTKGKTTTAFILYHLLRHAGHKVALLSTVKNSIDGFDFPTTLTTQQPDYLHQFFLLAHQAGVTHIVMEVAAQAISLHRIDGILFDNIIFTNFSHEHLEFYPSMEAYFSAKAALFDYAKPHAFKLVNADSAWCTKILQKQPDTCTFGTQKSCSYVLSIDKETLHVSFSISIDGNAYQILSPQLYGSFNAYNAAAAFLVARHYAISCATLQEGLKTFSGVPGRMQAIPLKNGATALIDYAHNPDSYEKLLSTLRPQTNHLVVVFGAGGSRDRTKRPLMGAIAAEYADVVVLTSDNPRFEDPNDIIADIKAGIPETLTHKVHSIVDRLEAIRTAYALSHSKSLIALLGKGPDEYQIIGNQKIEFSERSIVQSLPN